MDIILWVAQVMLSVTFLMTGALKLLQPKEWLAARMAWVNDFSATQLRGIGMLEMLGAAGVTMPWALRVMTFFTPLAALGLVLLMVGAAVTHIRRSEPLMLIGNVLLVVLAAVVATGRAGLF